MHPPERSYRTFRQCRNSMCLICCFALVQRVPHLHGMHRSYVVRAVHEANRGPSPLASQRMHLAVLRQAYRSKTSQDQARGKDAGASTTLSAFALPPSASTKVTTVDCGSQDFLPHDTTSSVGTTTPISNNKRDIEGSQSTVLLS